MSLFRDRMAEQRSAARQTIRPNCVLIVFASQSEATDNQLAGRRSEAVVIVVRCSGIERRTAINRATDFKPDCVIVFCVRDQGRETINSPDSDQTELLFVVPWSGDRAATGLQTRGVTNAIQ